MGKVQKDNKNGRADTTRRLVEQDRNGTISTHIRPRKPQAQGTREAPSRRAWVPNLAPEACPALRAAAHTGTRLRPSQRFSKAPGRPALKAGPQAWGLGLSRQQRVTALQATYPPLHLIPNIPRRIISRNYFILFHFKGWESKGNTK